MTVDPITLRVVSGALRAACEEMGAVLVKASHSANIKERRDASCALFDAEGQMVMQAEHIPVHLGAMPDAEAAVAKEDNSDGTPWVLNDPFAGGTHLPDITVITPVLADGQLLGFAASRAQGRQLVRHKHILVNGKSVNIPSYRVKPNDKIEIHEKSRKIPYITAALASAKNRPSPSWFEVDGANFTGTMKSMPVRDELNEPAIREQYVVEYYSR